MRIFRILAACLFVISLPVALVTTNIRFIANEPRIYSYAIDEFDAVTTTGIDREQLIRAGAEIRDYFRNDDELLAIEVTESTGRIAPLFNERETVHMKDVKDRFRTMNRLQEVSVLYAIAYVAAVVLWSKEVSPRGLALQLAAGAGIILVTIGVVGVIGMAGFDSAWVRFHEITFAGNDFWRLNPTRDHLIQFFPPPFWENVVFLIGLMVAAEAAVILVGAALYFGASRHAEAQLLQPHYA